MTILHPLKRLCLLPQLWVWGQFHPSRPACIDNSTKMVSKRKNRWSRFFRFSPWKLKFIFFIKVWNCALWSQSCVNISNQEKRLIEKKKMILRYLCEHSTFWPLPPTFPVPSLKYFLYPFSFTSYKLPLSTHISVLFLVLISHAVLRVLGPSL